MRILLLLLLFTLTSFNTPKPQTGCLKMDIILLVDFSTSVENNEQFIANAFSAFFNRFDLSEGGIRIAAYKFASDVTVITDFTSDKTTLIQATNNMRTYKANGTTNMAQALYKANNEFLYGGRQGVPKSLIIISDGLPSGVGSGMYGTPYNYGVKPLNPTTPNNSSPTYGGTSSFTCKSTIRNMKKTIPKLTIFGIMVGSGAEGESFMQEVSDFYVASSYQILVEELERLDICF